eukprot:COSAG01_NODE_11689_length_1878_cov_144.896009_1_plen_124_part_10
MATREERLRAPPSGLYVEYDTPSEPFSELNTLPQELVKLIRKQLSLSDQTRLGITSRRMRDISQVEFHNLMADLKLANLVTRYRSHLQGPRVVFDGELLGGGRSRTLSELRRRYLGGQTVHHNT